jgi:hypothetical protein
MAIPGIALSISDGALGLVPNNTDNVHVKLGSCSLGTVGTVYSFSDITTLKNTLGVGPLVEAAAHALAVAGGPVLCVPVTCSTAGAAGSITKSGTGGTVTVAGAAKDDYAVVVTVIQAGILGAGTFKFTLDGGDTLSDEITIPSGGTYALADTGLTLTFPAATYAAGTTYTFAATAPAFSSSDLTTAITALLATSTGFFMLHVVGCASAASGAATIAAAVDTALTSASTSYRYAFAIMDCPSDATNTDAVNAAAFASFASTRVAVCTGDVELVSAISGRVYRRNSSWTIAARAALVPPGEDLARFARGYLSSVVSLYRDEQQTQLLDAARFSTLRTHIGQPGFYITNGRLMAPAGSDYKYVQYRRVMDNACFTAYTAMLKYLNESLRVNADGTIFEKDAIAIESDVSAKLQAAVVTTGSATDASIRLSRTVNLTSTQNLTATIRVTPLGYAKSITVDIGFANPALARAA